MSDSNTPAWEEELHQRINDYIKDNSRLICESALMEIEIERLKAELAEAKDKIIRLMRVEQMDKRLVEQAHRDGWEQAKRDAEAAVQSADYDSDDWSRRNPEYVASRAVAGMKYKEDE